MKIRSLIIVVFLLVTNSLHSQHSEIGVMLGTSYYIGDINPSLHVVNKVRPAGGFFYRKNSNKRYSLRGGINYASLAASDATTGHQFNIERDVSFSAKLFEGYGILEFNFIPYQINNYNTSNFTPYVFIGFSVFYADVTVDPTVLLSIKGDDQIDTFAAPAIPFGMGIKFNFFENFGLGVEWGLRKTFTDKLDGLPALWHDNYQLSNSQTKDWYSIVGVTLNYKFLTKRDNCPGVIN